MNYLEEEISLAEKLSLFYVVSRMGFEVRRKGRYFTTKEMDSFMIYNDRTWCRHSRKSNYGKVGGGVIDFLMEYGDMTFPEAVEWALKEQGKMPEKLSEHQPLRNGPERGEFILPEHCENNKRVFAYLIKTRKISSETVNLFIHQGLLYESKEHHNMVFLGKDKDGCVRFASMRGTYDPPDREPFKCDVEGNDKHYGVNLYRKGCRQVAVFEGCVDMMSFLELTSHQGYSLLALGMVGDAPLCTFLSEHEEIKKILLVLDHDTAGREATERIRKRYTEKGYEVEVFEYPEEMKDLNQYLKEIRKNQHAKYSNGGIYVTSKSRESDVTR